MGIMKLFPTRFAAVLLATAMFSVFQRDLSAQAISGPSPIGPTLTRTLPYSFVGRLLVSFAGVPYQGSGTVVRPHSVLTAGHMLWDPDAGWATNLYFQRAYYYGSQLSVSRPNHKYILAGYSRYASVEGSDSDDAFTKDFGAMTFTGEPAKGRYLPYSVNLGYLNGRHQTISVGYGADWHDGEQMLKCSPPIGSAFAYVPDIGGTMYYFNDFYIIEGGMSGGPLFVKTSAGWNVIAINVSGDDSSMGIHALGSSERSFLEKYLK